MTTLDETWQSATDYLETLGDERCPTIMLDWRRTDDGRRDLMARNGSLLNTYLVQISWSKKAGDEGYQTAKVCQWDYIKGHGDTPQDAVTDAVAKVRDHFEGLALV